MELGRHQFSGLEKDGLISLQIHEDKNPVVLLARRILQNALEREASDIHLEPVRDGLMVRCRIDGVLQLLQQVPVELRDPLISRFKIVARMDIGEKRLPQDGRITTNWKGQPVDIRLSSLPTLFGEKLVMRILDREKGSFSLNRLGFTDRNLQALTNMMHQPFGLILITGPTGSGKSTTLYAMLSELNDPGKNIITVEDPIEYQLDGINQVAVHPAIGLTFASCLRSILRQDPDLIAVGEIRDRETAEISIHAALTGHLVFSTLHTNTAAGAVSRLLNLGIDPYLAASALRGVVAQRLVRRLCPHCRQAYTAADGSWEEKYFYLTRQRTLFRALGCEACHQTGFHGRVAVQEVFPLSEKSRYLIIRGKGEQTLEDQARREGMDSLFSDGKRKVLAGLTSPREMLRVYGPHQEEELRRESVF
jgi:type II secretory ATPase GspE/PulE/Tfp pilus assembly ATPase PilB-like protein